MDDPKADLTRDYLTLLETHVQFGDNKASSLVAADAILLATMVE